MAVKITKLRPTKPSMAVPGDGSVEIPMNMEHTLRGGKRNAREFANAMDGVGGRGKPVGPLQYQKNGAQGDGDDM